MATDASGILLTKIAAAKRQLDAAIRLTLHGEDELAIHTLGAAAYRILRDLKKKRGRNELSDLYSRGIYFIARDIVQGKLAGLPPEIQKDSTIVEWVNHICDCISSGKVKNEADVSALILLRDENEYWNKHNEPSNFLKHADLDSEEILHLNLLNNELLLRKAVACYIDIMRVPSVEMFIYSIYSFGHDPSFRTPLWDDRLADTFVRLSPARRRRFCRSYLSGLRKIWNRNALRPTNVSNQAPRPLT